MDEVKLALPIGRLRPLDVLHLVACVLGVVRGEVGLIDVGAHVGVLLIVGRDGLLEVANPQT